MSTTADGGYGGAGIGGNASGFSNVENDISLVDTTTKYVTPTSQYNMGQNIGAGDSSTITVNAGDMGAIAAGLALGQAGIQAASSSAQKTVDAAILGISRASDIVATKAESDITKFFKPLIWLAVIVAVVILGGKWLAGKD